MKKVFIPKTIKYVQIFDVFIVHKKGEHDDDHGDKEEITDHQYHRHYSGMTMTVNLVIMVRTRIKTNLSRCCSPSFWVSSVSLECILVTMSLPLCSAVCS